MVTTFAGWTLVGLSLLGSLYASLACAATLAWLKRPRPTARVAPDVTVIKPLCGAPPGLAAILDRFCVQDYAGAVQIVFGVHDSADPAIAIVRDLQRAHPDRDIALMVDPRIHGANLKASNLINIIKTARHEVLILSDADIVVETDYIRTVVGALAQPGVGLVSCLYVGRERTGLWSQLSAMAITYQFMPGAILGKAGRLAEPCFGSTIAIRADVLARTGGFAAFADHLADDYEIGAAVRRLGLKIALPPITVAHICDEADARALIERELRWGRVVRQISPLGYAGSLITYPLPLMVLGAALLGFSGAAMLLLLATLASRLVFKLAIDFAAKAPAGRWWLMPVSDTLAFGLFLASFGVNRVDWRGARFRVSREGALLPS